MATSGSRRMTRREYWADPPSEVPASLVSEGATPGEIQVLFPASVGLEATAVMLGLAVVALTMWAGGLVLHAVGTSIPSLWTPVLVLVLCAGSIFGSSRICRRSQRGRWTRAVGAEPTSEMVVALTSSAMVIWDDRRLREDASALIAEVQRTEVTAAYAPAWAGAGGGVRASIANRGSISFSLHGPPTRKAVEQFVAALGGSTTMA
jgi:hypothetical protein